SDPNPSPIRIAEPLAHRTWHPCTLRPMPTPILTLPVPSHYPLALQGPSDSMPTFGHCSASRPLLCNLRVALHPPDRTPGPVGTLVLFVFTLFGFPLCPLISP